MRIEAREIVLASNEKENRANRREARVTASLSRRRLKQAVDGFDEAVGLAGLGPRNNSVEVSANQSRDVPSSVRPSSAGRWCTHCCNV